MPLLGDRWQKPHFIIYKISNKSIVPWYYALIFLKKIKCG